MGDRKPVLLDTETEALVADLLGTSRPTRADRKADAAVERAVAETQRATTVALAQVQAQSMVQAAKTQAEAFNTTVGLQAAMGLVDIGRALSDGDEYKSHIAQQFIELFVQGQRVGQVSRNLK